MLSSGCNTSSDAASNVQQNVAPTAGPKLNHGASTRASTAQSRLRARVNRKAAKTTQDNAQLGHNSNSSSSNEVTGRKTRSAAVDAPFPLMKVPVEVRSNIFSLVLKTPDRFPINNLTIPPLLQVNRQIRSEAIGLLTTVNELHLTVRSTHDVNGNRDSTTLHTSDSGVLHLHRALRAWLIRNDSSFRELRITITCACCSGGALIGEFRIVLPENNTRYVVSAIPHPRANEDGRLGVMFGAIEGEVRRVLGEAEARYGRAAIKVADLKKIAACFRGV